MPVEAAEDDCAIERWLKSLLASTSETAIVVLTCDGTLLAWRGAAQVLFGSTPGEAVGMPSNCLFTPEDVRGQLDRQERELALASGRSEDDRGHVRRDGNRFWGSGVMEPIRAEDGEVVALAKVLRDRSDGRIHVVALQNRLQAAEAQNLDRLKAFASLKHKLRNQVSPLVNFVGAIEKPAGAQPATGAMRRQLDVPRRLLEDLAQAAAVVAARPTLAVAAIDVQPVLAHAARSMQAAVAQRGQTLTVTVPDAPITIEADTHRIDQVLVNLISNASKFTPAGGGIQLSATVEDDMVAIRVEDDGDGIAADVLPKIFELFTREARARAPDSLRIGLPS